MMQTPINNITLGSLFSGSGGFELAGVLNGITPLWNSEIKPFPMLVTSKRFPDGNKQLGDISKIKGNSLEPVDIITFGSPCFPAGTPVLTNKGYKAIEYIREGDFVLTHKNRFMKVLKIGGTPDQAIFELNAQGILPIQATATHPFIVRTKENDKFTQAYQKPLFMIGENDYIGVPILQSADNPHNITEEEAFSLGNYLGKKYNLFNEGVCVEECDILYNELNDKMKPFAQIEQISSEILNLPSNIVKAFVKGYFEYDVYHIKHKTFCKTSDIEFAMNLCLAIQKGFNVGCYICESKVFTSGTYIVSFNPNPDNPNWVIIDNTIWYPVYSSENLGYKENVFNLEVEEDHTYVVQNCIVHNCQDLSQAGKREGLDGSRSCLFHDAIRIIKEMRSKTNGQYPRYIVWENVTGALSSGQGDDFRTVLEEIAKIKDETAKIPMPQSGKWESAGEILGDNYSIAWRVFDSQWWGVPQRRRRIFLVADCGGNSAGKILFDTESLSGYSPQSGKERQGAAENIEGCFGRSSEFFTDGIHVGEYSGCEKFVSFVKNPVPVDNVASTLRSQAGAPKHMSDFKGRLCIVDKPKGFHPQNSTTAGGLCVEEDSSPTLSCTKRAGVLIPLAFDGYNSKLAGEVSPTLGVNCGMSTGRNSLLCINDQGGKSINIERGDISPTLRAQAHGNIPIIMHGKNDEPAICLQGSMIGRKDTNGPLGNGINADLAFTLNTIDRHAVEYQKVVRRFTPIECGRLQGFYDWWCDGLNNPEPSEEEITYWENVWETYRIITNAFKKPKSRAQIKKWLQNPYSDEAMYIMWGNGVALPCVYFILYAIKWNILNNKEI